MLSEMLNGETSSKIERELIVGESALALFLWVGRQVIAQED
jgi:hypothetical protein